MRKELLIDWDLYTCYEDGRIFSKCFNKGRFLKGYTDKKGYVKVRMKSIDGNERLFLWHRVIYTYFNGEIPDGIQVNHIDENPNNNALSNLNLMTCKENINWGTGNERRAKKLKEVLKGKKHTEETKIKIGKALSKPVEALDKDGNIVHRFASTAEAGRNGYFNSHVSNCCNGKAKTYKGLIWRYAV